MKLKFFAICMSFAVFFGCKNTPNVGNINLSVELERFDNDFFALADHSVTIKDNIVKLENNYGEFFKLYNEEIIYIGSSSSEEYISNLDVFFENDAVKIARDEVVNSYTDFSDINKELTLAFKYYKYYFPENTIPKVYSFISGFNQSIMLGDNFIGIGLDKYLGSDKEIYKDLGLYKYMVKNMNKENIAPDCMQALALGEWPFNYNRNDVISQMIYQGMQLYFCRMMLPTISEHLIFGFSTEELTWCKNNERPMWALLLEEKLLFSTDNFNISRLTGPAPYTSVFPAESPGKACNWIGYRIVEKYMKNNKDISLKDLMSTKNYGIILEKAKYSPSK